jgi:hypothetical protein
MKRIATILLGSVVTIALASSAFAAPRVPQVAVVGGSLQGYFNGVGETINVLTDQQDISNWSSSISGNTTYTLMIELGGNAAANTIGIYNAGVPAPALYQVFPGAAAADWYATVSFRNFPTRAVVNLFDNNAVLQGTTTYLGADRTNFGYYIQGPGGTFYSQDYRNGGNAQALVYPGHGVNAGQWWLAFEDVSVTGGSDQDYDDAVLFLESVNESVPVSTTTWGQLKTRMR